MRGKKGPKPERPEEIAERENDPTAEEIVGAENVVDVEGVQNVDDLPASDYPPAPQGYKCANCTFTSGLLSEMEEHVNGTGHGKFDAEPVQPELFSTPGVIHKSIEVPLPAEELNQKRAKLAELYQEVLNVKDEKKSADSDFNEQLKSLDESMQAIARVLKNPFTRETVDCEWHIIDGENARELRRLDTGEVVDKQPLSMEDKLAEEEKAATENAEPDAPCIHGVASTDRCMECWPEETDIPSLVEDGEVPA